MLWVRRDGIFTLVVCWALWGIHIKRAASDAGGSELVAGAALGGLAVLVLALILAGWSALRARRLTA
jgi:hypothetical protein